jgi:4'-phosphopantetheinyl transferase
MPLRRDEAHVWYAPLDDGRRPADMHPWLRVLSAEERDRHGRLLRGGDEYLLAHALLRTALSRYAAVEPEAWVFDRNRHGRPEVSAALTSDPLRFSLSHTEGLVACAVTRGATVGVDVENTTRSPEIIEIADRFFAPPESRALRALDGPARRARFFELWTLKEAYVKARGLGLTLPLAEFAFLIDGGPIHVEFTVQVTDDARRWHFELFRPAPRHTMAVALGRAPDRPVRVHVGRAYWLASPAPA